MTVKQVIERVELAMGPSPHAYLIALVNDGLNEISAEVKHMQSSNSQNLLGTQRWYTIAKNFIDVKNVYMKDSNGDYTKIPLIMNPEELIVEDAI